MGAPSVTVVTPWRNAPELAAGYWAAMRALAAEDRVTVIDNGSDPPLQHDPVDPRVVVFRNEENVGFARACNEGLESAQTDAVLFLNNDVVPAGGDWLAPIRAHLRPGVLVGPDLRIDGHTAVDGRPQIYLDGWCLAGMRADLVELGGFDEAFEEPSYFGDNDLCARARARGMKLVEVPVALRHLGNWTAKHERLDVREVSMRNYERYAARVRDLAAAP